MFIDLIWCRKEKFIILVEIIEEHNWENLFGSSFANVLIPNALDGFCESFELIDGVYFSRIIDT